MTPGIKARPGRPTGWRGRRRILGDPVIGPLPGAVQYGAASMSEESSPAEPPPAPADARRGLGRRTGFVIGTAVALVLGSGVVTAMALAGGRPAAPIWRAASVPSDAPATSAVPTSEPKIVTGQVALAATGDIIMGDAPGQLPPNNAADFFAGVTQALTADLTMGNLEEPLTDDTGYVKCRVGSTDCHQFRAPPGYAVQLRNAGFKLLNLANNHAFDYGPTGHRNTQRALEQHGLAHTGDPDQITVVTVNAVRVAVLGFSSYSWSNSLLDIARARTVVQRAAAAADLVVVQVHMGGEGTDRTHVRPGTEMFLGEDRGDPIKFAHAVVDAGADLVVGHGPHVMRALEFYQGRLIAYSLGNFAGGSGTLAADGILGYGAVLKVTLHRDGGWMAGTLVATTHQGGGGLPRIDSQRRGLALVRSLCTADFPQTGARLGTAGEITPQGN